MVWLVGSEVGKKFAQQSSEQFRGQPAGFIALLTIFLEFVSGNTIFWYVKTFPCEKTWVVGLFRPYLFSSCWLLLRSACVLFAVS